MDLTERKLRGMGGYDESGVQRRRLMGMLMRKGWLMVRSPRPLSRRS